MGRRVFKKNAISTLKQAVFGVLFTASACLLVVYGVLKAEASSVSEGRRILEEGLRRAAVSCYVNEGAYPDSLSYIEENYGISVNSEKYAVFYEITAGNIFPDITVITLEPVGDSTMLEVFR